MGKAWKTWQKISKKIMGFQANIVLFVVYILLIIPFGLFLKFFSPKSLLGHRHTTKKNSFWLPYPKTTYDISFAQKQ